MPKRRRRNIPLLHPWIMRNIAVQRPAPDTARLRPGEERQLFLLAAIRGGRWQALFDRWPRSAWASFTRTDYLVEIARAVKDGYLKEVRFAEPKRWVTSTPVGRLSGGTGHNGIKLTSLGEKRLAELGARIQRPKPYLPTGRRVGWGERLRAHEVERRASIKEVAP